jgi:hypothetical protein
MKLREKFRQWLDTEPREQIRDVQLEVIAENFAIGFAKWLLVNCWLHDDEYWELVTKDGNVRKTEEELLETYKKEKGL